jgi:hypothetical protein
MRHLIFACLAVLAATADASRLRVGVGGREAFEFRIEQSIEGMEGRVAEVKDASPHTAARPFSRLNGTLTLTRVCAAGGVEGVSVMEGKVRDVRVAPRKAVADPGAGAGAAASGRARGGGGGGRAPPNAPGAPPGPPAAHAPSGTAPSSASTGDCSCTSVRPRRRLLVGRPTRRTPPF